MSDSRDLLLAARRRAKLALIAARHGWRRVVRGEESVRFRCNVCGRNTRALRAAAASREAVSCTRCGATLRYRAVIRCLSLCLFGDDRDLGAFPRSDVLTGFGTSDDPLYAERLARRVRFRNTWYHREPRCDLRDPPIDWLGENDFVLCSDVLEHVSPPVADAFAGLHALLKPGGHLILTVPYRDEGPLIEHYQDLHDWRIDARDGRFVLVNRTRDGEDQVFEDPVFHGGPGQTVELRLFSRRTLREHLEAAGFEDIQEHTESVPDRGIFLEGIESVPWTARRPRHP